MRFVLIPVALSLFTLGCPAEDNGKGRDLPATNLNTGAGASSAPSLVPVEAMPNFAGAASQPGSVIPSSQPGSPGTVIPSTTLPPAAADAFIVGPVLELHQVKEYTYMRIGAADGEVWAAVPKNDAVALGQQVKVQRDMWMNDFQSPSLGRSFDKIAFGNLM